MDKGIKITIDGKEFLAKEDQTILEVAQENGIDLPTLCFHPDLEVKANCRLCLVEIKGDEKMKTACSTEVKDGMEVIINSPKLHHARKFNLELIFSQHKEKCHHCVWRFDCQLRKLAKNYNVQMTKFAERKAKRNIYQFGPIVYDAKKCIDCRNCVEVCPVKFYEISGKGAETEIKPAKRKNNICIYCGQCIVHCPVGTIISAGGESQEIENLLKEKNKLMIVQFAPSIRATIGEKFGFAYGKDVTGRLIAGLRKLGFNLVFDTSVGADFTTTAEAEELAERLKEKKNLPMFTSCCPSWVRLVEAYYPEFIPNLTTVRSPHIILGGLTKNYFIKEKKIEPRKIIIVSIMPCTAKRYEALRPELKIKGVPPVDYVLTTRELIYLFKKHNIDLKKIESEEPDNPFGSYSGAGVIYGASGGVMESALRTAYEKISGKKLSQLDFEMVRGMREVKTAKIKIGEKEIKVGVVNGAVNAEQILEEIKKNPRAFHYLEFMACPGGCIGGGGQPLPVSDEIRQKRAMGLYKIDVKKKIRLAHENPIVKKINQEFKQDMKMILYTKFSPKKTEKTKIIKETKKPLWKKLKL